MSAVDPEPADGADATGRARSPAATAWSARVAPEQPEHPVLLRRIVAAPSTSGPVTPLSLHRSRAEPLARPRHAVDLGGGDRLVLPGRPGEVPAVHDEVEAHELVDGVLDLGAPELTVVLGVGAGPGRRAPAWTSARAARNAPSGSSDGGLAQRPVQRLAASSRARRRRGRRAGGQSHSSHGDGFDQSSGARRRPWPRRRRRGCGSGRRSRSCRPSSRRGRRPVLYGSDIGDGERAAPERAAAARRGVRPAMARASLARCDWSVYPALAASSASPRSGRRTASVAKRCRRAIRAKNAGPYPTARSNRRRSWRVDSPVASASDVAPAAPDRRRGAAPAGDRVDDLGHAPAHERPRRRPSAAAPSALGQALVQPARRRARRAGRRAAPGGRRASAAATPKTPAAAPGRNADAGHLAARRHVERPAAGVRPAQHDPAAVGPHEVHAPVGQQVVVARPTLRRTGTRARRRGRAPARSGVNHTSSPPDPLRRRPWRRRRAVLEAAPPATMPTPPTTMPAAIARAPGPPPGPRARRSRRRTGS